MPLPRHSQPSAAGGQEADRRCHQAEGGTPPQMAPGPSSTLLGDSCRCCLHDWRASCPRVGGGIHYRYISYCEWRMYLPRSQTPLPSFLSHPAFIHGAIKSWGVESGNEARMYIMEYGSTPYVGMAAACTLYKLIRSELCSRCSHTEPL